MGYVPSNQNGQATMANSAPVVIASDQSGLTIATGSIALQEAATGGANVYHLATTASTSPTSIKSSAGKVTGWYVYNNNGSARKVAFHNTATAPVAGTSVYFSIVIPPLSAANVSYPAGINFSSGIGMTTTTGLADSDATAVAATDLIINIFWK